MITSSPDVSLVVPVLNEQEIVAETIEVFLRDLSSVCNNYELIVVDDGSTDNTRQILQNLSLIYGEKLKIITNLRNLGSGRSLIIGFKNAKFPLVATNFADRPFELKELKNIFPLFLQGADFVVVCRHNRSANNIYRKLTSIINYYFIRLLFNVKVRDFQFVQVYRREMLYNLNVNANHTFVPPELIIRALSKGYTIAEYKTAFYPRSKGKAKCGHPRIIFYALCDLFKFWLKFKVFRII